MIYIGGYKAEQNQGIYALCDDLSFHHQICTDDGTSYFDVDQNGIYTIIKENEQGGVAIYDHKGLLKSKALFDKKPGCFIKKHDDKIYVAYYHDACVQVFDLQLNLLKEIQFESGAKCHQIAFFHEGIAVVCLGLDQIIFYDDNYQVIRKIHFPKGSGPRHLVSKKDESEIYVLSELSNELFILKNHKIVQFLSIKQNDIPTSGAAIRLSEDEKHLYTSTRGQNLIKHFIREDIWKEAQCYPLTGIHPRDFNLKSDSVIVGYQGTDLVEIITLDEEKNLKETIHRAKYDKIVCVKYD